MGRVLKSDVKRLFIGALIAGATLAMAQDVTITAQLNGPLSAGSSRKGDLVAAQVVSPDSLKGDTIQGMVTQTSSARGQSSVQFNFTLLRHGSMNVPVTATIEGITNSKGTSGIDDQGQTLRATTAPGAKPVSASRFGGQLGGLIGGRTGQAVSDAGSDVNTSGSASGPMQISSGGPSLELGTGSALTVSVKSNNGPSLDSLPPNAPQTVTVGVAPPLVTGPQQTASAGVAPSGAGSGAQPEMKSNKIEFVPGDRTTFYEDFSDWVDGEPPPHWKVRNGTVELRMGGNIHEMHAEQSVNLFSPTIEVPINFTLELDFSGTGQTTWELKDKDDHSEFSLTVRGEPDGKEANIVVNGPDGQLGEGGIPADNSQPIRFSFWAQQGRVRAYLNGQRLVDANQVKFEPITHMNVDLAGYRPNSIRMVRVAESSPDFSAVINASGKYVTHGINFDTDSDHLKPESAAVLKQVAAGLARNPNLKLEVDGYTDSVGKADHNLDLSKRRAQAVQAVLVSQFGIDADRLTSNGFGADNPIGSNDTPDGRANNRRVEFLKK
jgi:OOP family OmpA-OmpF porin